MSRNPPISKQVCILAAMLGGVGALACETTPEQRLAGQIQRELEDAPSWVLESCDRHWSDEDARICGVGSMGGTRNIALARSTAMARARSEIARSLQLRVEAMLKDYQSATTAGAAFGQSHDEQNVVDVSRQITELSLSGTELEETWISPETGTYYTLMSLDLERFEAALEQMRDLSPEMRQGVLERAEGAFHDLDRRTGGIEEEVIDPVW